MAMRKTVRWLAFGCSVTAVGLMMFPTFATAYSGDGGERGLRYHRWFDLFPLVYLHVVPALALICGIAMAAGLTIGLLRGRAYGWIAIPGIAAALGLLLSSYDTSESGFVTGTGQLVAPMLGTASVLAAIAWWLERRSTTAK